MKKLFFIIILFSLSNSFAQVDSVKQKRFNHVINLSRWIILEPSYGLRINISDKFYIQPEVSYRPKILNSNYNGKPNLFEIFKNEYSFNNVMFAFTNGIEFSDDYKIEFTPFYRTKNSDSIEYWEEEGCNSSGAICYVSYYKGGGLKINKYGIKSLVAFRYNKNIELYAGMSIFKQDISITYNEDYSYYEYGGGSHNYYDNLQTKKESGVYPFYQLGLNLVL